MPQRRLSMRHTKEILRLSFEQQLSNRKIAESLGISHTIVNDYVARAKRAGIGWPLPEQQDDEVLEQLLFPPEQQRPDDSKPMRLAKTKILVIDDLGLAPLNDVERRDLLEVIEDRYNLSSTIVASQLPLDLWHDTIGDPTIADAILDRLIHNAYKIQLKGGSMRKQSNQQPQD